MDTTITILLVATVLAFWLIWKWESSQDEWKTIPNNRFILGEPELSGGKQFYPLYVSHDICHNLYPWKVVTHVVSKEEATAYIESVGGKWWDGVY